MDYTHSHLEIWCKLCRCIQTPSYDTHSHINLLISSSKHPPYLPIMTFPFRDILPCNFPPFRSSSWHTLLLSYCHCMIMKLTSYLWQSHHALFFIHVTLDSLHHPGTPPEAFIESYLVLVSSCNSYVVINRSVMIIIIRALPKEKKERKKGRKAKRKNKKGPKKGKKRKKEIK